MKTPQNIPNLPAYATRCLVMIALVLTGYGSDAQTEKGSNAIILHSFNPSGIHIDGLPMTIFPNNSGLGFSFGSHKIKMDGERTDVKENVLAGGLSLSAHYFIFDNLSLGLTGNLYTGTTTYKQAEVADDKYKSTMLMAGAEIRYYIKGGSRLKYFLKASPALGSITSTFNGTPVHLPKRLYQFTGGGGISYFPSPSFSIDLGVSYNVFTIRNRGSYHENSKKEYVDSIGADIGFSIFF